MFSFRDLIEKAQTRRCLHPAPSPVGHGQDNRFAVVLGRVVFQDMPPQNVVSIHGVPLPWKEKDLRSSNLLTGM